VRRDGRVVGEWGKGGGGVGEGWRCTHAV
jgi:hypothetical protein